MGRKGVTAREEGVGCMRTRGMVITKEESIEASAHIGEPPK